MPKQKQKSVGNQICGINGCAKPATMTVAFQFGFSSRFCGLLR